MTTAQRLAAESWQNNRETLLAAVTELTTDAIFIKDTDGRCVLMNHNGARWLNTTPDDAIGKRADDFFSAEQAASIRKQDLAILDAGSPLVFEETLDFPTGRRTPSTVGVPYRGPHHCILGLIFISRDITETKNYQQALEASRVKDEFLATVSHELRTPMAVIFGWTEILRSHMLPAGECDKAYDIIYRNAKTEMQLIDNLLEISNILSGKILLSVDDTDLNATVSSSIVKAASCAQKKDVILTSQLATHPVIVKGDAERLQQILGHILSNAVKFTPPGGIIEASLSADTRNATIVVKDSGVGIGKEFIPFVFDRFRQEDATLGRNFGGMGLGLSIAKHLAHMHGGDIVAESPGRDLGSTFRITLPLAHTAWDNAFREVEPSLEIKEMTKLVDAVEILLVDDAEDIVVMMAALLTKLGAKVYKALSSQEALTLLEKVTPDVIISDLEMPREDGYQFISKVRGNPRLRSIPAIALTAHAREEDCRRALQAGYQLHLAKPVHTTELVQAIYKLSRGT